MAKVLIIEDERAMSDLIAIKFKVEGFEVEQAVTLTEAKEQLNLAPFDVILTDYLLPDGDLVEFLSSLRSDPRFAKLPVMVMTNYVEDVNFERLKQLNVTDTLVKYQVVPAQMVEKVKQLLNQPVQVAQQPEN